MKLFFFFFYFQSFQAKEHEASLEKINRKMLVTKRKLLVYFNNQKNLSKKN